MKPTDTENSSSLMELTYQGRKVRVVIIDGQPWWVAKDVCEALGHSNNRAALERLDDDEKGVSTVYTPGGPQKMAVVNEAGLYRLIFTSRVEQAEQFKRWTYHEVLPSIRKTGEYKTSERRQQDEIAQKRIMIMELNAKTRQAKLLLDMTYRFKDRLSDVAIESLLAFSANLLAGREMLPLPTTERLYTATEIAEELGVSANAVGRAANALGLKTDEFGKFVLDKSPYSNKQVEAFRYNERGREMLTKHFMGNRIDLEE
ncbi:phage repressor protein [Alicyclobacillus acidocaldarius]|uniref:Prophage antirepressor n=1 Tax=Alicyclobacillus acidocaldarius (strain Tc-4-1) TaxID=1048834 RepID=F8IDE5_ALIAT|nr:phage repressor protein [Alicyclobacillus acidocaldarius]AEJ43798.1 prophage antirepressor [Alicyclobacillus acidocaldarius subsp. acidocaldarius Tc-4-1]